MMAEPSYVFSRGAPASVRYVHYLGSSSINIKLDKLIDILDSLYIQHWMWRYQTGYILHPKVDTSKDNLKVADIACGTGY